jgi:HEPN domain
MTDAGSGYDRDTLRSIAQAKLDDAELLIQNKRFSNGYYLVGYAIEVGLKACIARQFVADVIPDRKYVDAIYTHQLDDLVKLAGLSQELANKQHLEANFGANWALVAQWRESTRYEEIDQATAEDMMRAVIDARSGVFEWIKVHW